MRVSRTVASESSSPNEQALKEALDSLTYPFGFFREYDEPNESFAPRVALALPALAPRVAALPIWPNIPNQYELWLRNGSAASVEKETTMSKTNDKYDGPFLVIAQVGPAIRETDKYIEMRTIVMAVRETEEEAERERDRRNALNDGRYYFVMSEAEYDQAA